MIKLDENYTIEGTANYWLLRYEKTGDINAETGKPKISRNEYYHNTLQNALASYADKKLKEIEDIPAGVLKLSEDLKQLFNEIRNFKQ